MTREHLITEMEMECLRLLYANDSNPCGWCGTLNNKHSHLHGGEIKKKRKCGNRVRICEGPNFPNNEDLLTIKWLMFRCVVTTPPPGDPCDRDFMEKISS